MTGVLSLEYQPDNPAACMILMHGLGASGDDLYPLAKTLANGRLRVVLPHAPMRAVTVNGGWKMRAWYDIIGADLESRQDATGVAESAAVIKQLIAAEKERGFPAEQIFLAGFSQGAAMALHIGLRYAEKLAGVVCLSGYLLFAENTPSADAASPKIFQAHGNFDSVVLPQWAHTSRDILLEKGYDLTYREYSAPHVITPNELDDLNEWLKQQLFIV